jgi:hypothetical protein
LLPKTFANPTLPRRSEIFRWNSIRITPQFSEDRHKEFPRGRGDVWQSHPLEDVCKQGIPSCLGLSVFSDTRRRGCSILLVSINQFVRPDCPLAQKTLQSLKSRLHQRLSSLVGDDSQAFLKNDRLHSCSSLRVWIFSNQRGKELDDLAHGAMLILLVPFNIKIEQAQASSLRRSSSSEYGRLSAFALFNKVTEFNTSISGSMTRLGSFREELLELFFSNSERQLLACLLIVESGFTLTGSLPVDLRAISRKVDRQVEAAGRQLVQQLEKSRPWWS